LLPGRKECRAGRQQREGKSGCQLRAFGSHLFHNYTVSDSVCLTPGMFCVVLLVFMFIFHLIIHVLFCDLIQNHLPGVRCSFFNQGCNLLRPGDVDRVAGAGDFDLAIAKPMPLVEPEISAVLPRSSRFMIHLFNRLVVMVPITPPFK
jgi:hypothetical protein